MVHVSMALCAVLLAHCEFVLVKAFLRLALKSVHKLVGLRWSLTQ